MRFLDLLPMVPRLYWPSTSEIRTGRFLLAAAVLMLAGCGGVEMAAVTGTVYYRDKPLSYGSVMFQPMDGGPAARATIGSDGSFALTTVTPDGETQAGVQVGACRVRVTAFEAQRPGQAVNREQELALGKSAVPKKYQRFATSGIVVDVHADMELPLELRLD